MKAGSKVGVTRMETRNGPHQGVSLDCLENSPAA